jgi:hypothetical protein
MSGRYKIFPFILFLFYFACILCPGRFAFASPNTQQQFARDDTEQPCDHERHNKSDHQCPLLTSDYLPSQKINASPETVAQPGVLTDLEVMVDVARPIVLSPQHPPNFTPGAASLIIKLRI